MQRILLKQKLTPFLLAVLVVAVLTLVLIYGKGRLLKGFITPGSSGGWSNLSGTIQTQNITLPEEAQACNVMGGTFAVIRDNAICVVNTATGIRTYQWDQRENIYRRIRNLQ